MSGGEKAMSAQRRPFVNQPCMDESQTIESQTLTSLHEKKMAAGGKSCGD